MPNQPASSGCRYCGLDQNGHAQRWSDSAGWHPWTPPTREQTHDRMKARHERRNP